MRIPYFSLLAAGALTLGGCAYGDLGYGGGYGSGYYGGYGGYGGYNGDPYYGYGYGSPYFGWYDDFYYPGAGLYVYDSGRHRRVWNDRERTYWTNRQHAATTTTTSGQTVRENWSGFNHRSGSRRH
jgi:hypothetical protein